MKLIKSLPAPLLTAKIFFAGCGGGESKGTHAGSFGAPWVVPVIPVVMSTKTITTIFNQAGAAINSISVAVLFHAQATIVDVTGAVASGSLTRLLKYSLTLYVDKS